MKTLTVIIPVYNEEPFLVRCFDSVLEAIEVVGEDRVEVIVIDDGSTDGSGKVCDNYKDKFKVIHQKNQGVSAARNRGIDEATGQYITFLDSDDVMTQYGIRNMIAAIEERNGQEILQFEHQRFYTEYNRVALKYTNASRFYNMNMPPRMWCMVWNKAYLRKFINDNKLRFKVGLQYGEDEIFNLECFAICNELYHVDKVSIMRYFENQQSLCHTLSREKLLAQNDALLELLVRENNTDEFTRFVRGVLAEHWSSVTYRNMFGGLQ